MEEFEVANKLFKEWNVLSWAGASITLVVLLVLIKKYLFSGFGVALNNLTKTLITLETERARTITRTDMNLTALSEEIKKTSERIQALATTIIQNREYCGNRIELVEQRFLESIRKVDMKIIDMYQVMTKLSQTTQQSLDQLEDKD